jgi:uncharacterized protein (DUF362 family)
MNDTIRQLAVVYGAKPAKMVPRLMDCLGVTDEIQKAQTVGIKPNLVVSKPSSSGATTDPEIVGAVIEVLQSKGIRNIVILESAWLGDSTEQAFEVCGYRELGRRFDVPLINLEEDTTTEHRVFDMSIQVCDKAMKLDYLIGVPVLKAHCQTRLTCALKNQKGLIPNSEKRRFHDIGLDRPIAYLNKIIKPNFVIVDGIVGDLSFEEGGNPVRMNRLIGGRDPVLVDAFAATLLGYAPHDIAHVRIAEEIGLGTTDLKRATVKHLNQPDDQPLDPAELKPSDELLRRINQDRACSACVGSILHALKRLGGPSALSRLPGKLAVGQGFKKKHLRGIGIGKCTKHFDTHLPGCPPSALEIKNFLKSLVY